MGGNATAHLEQDEDVTAGTISPLENEPIVENSEASLVNEDSCNDTDSELSESDDVTINYEKSFIPTASPDTYVYDYDKYRIVFSEEDCKAFPMTNSFALDIWDPCFRDSEADDDSLVRVSFTADRDVTNPFVWPPQYSKVIHDFIGKEIMDGWRRLQTYMSRIWDYERFSHRATFLNSQPKNAMKLPELVWIGYLISQKAAQKMKIHEEHLRSLIDDKPLIVLFHPPCFYTPATWGYKMSELEDDLFFPHIGPFLPARMNPLCPRDEKVMNKVLRAQLQRLEEEKMDAEELDDFMRSQGYETDA